MRRRGIATLRQALLLGLGYVVGIVITTLCVANIAYAIMY